MSVLQTANVWFESTGNNRIQSSGNGMTIVAGGSNVAVVNTTAFTISNSSYLVVGNSSVNTVVNATTVAVGGVSVNAASLNPYQGIKNRIINGDMRVDQRGNQGANSVVANTATRIYGVDRWAIQASAGATRYFTMQQKSDTPPTGHSYYLRSSVTAGGTPGATDVNFLSQPIEGYTIGDLDFGKATAKTITLSAWVRSSLSGTFSGSILNYASNRAYPFTFSVPSINTWTQISVTIPGDTTGTWTVDNSGSMFVIFDLGSGSTYKTTAGSWAAGQYFGATSSTVTLVGTTNATFDLTGVQLEIGSSATLFDRRTFQAELAMCQRYYWKSSYSGVGSGYPGILGNCYTQAYYSTAFAFPVRMRATPTQTVANQTSWYRSNVISTGYPIIWVNGPDGFVLYLTSAAAGNISCYPQAIDQYIDASAEL